MGSVRRLGIGGWGKRFGSALAGLALGLWLPSAALAEEARPWQLGMQPSVTPVRDHIDAFHDELLVIITLIALFVLGLLLYVMLRFNARRNPVPSRTSHNTLIEVIWTVVPVLILMIIFVPSMKLLYYADKAQHADMTLKVTGHQWYWSYEYPDQGGLAFDSNMIPEGDAVKAGKPRLLAVDNPVVVPVGTTIRILVAGTDVMHSWFLPAAGVQEYAVIGRVNESWMNIEKEGTYYGQCNQICGINHPFMPIEVQAVSKADFAKWLEDAKRKFAHDDGQGLRLAAQAAH